MKTRIIEVTHPKKKTYYLVEKKFLFFWITETRAVLDNANSVDFVPMEFDSLESALNYKNEFVKETRRIVNEAK